MEATAQLAVPALGCDWDGRHVWHERNRVIEILDHLGPCVL